MIYNINKFRHYLLGKNFTFHVDHTTLLYLVSKQALVGNLARWMLLLQEFDFVIQHRPCTQHAIADYLGRIENGADAVDGDDDLLTGLSFTLKPRTLSNLTHHTRINGSQK